MAEAHLFGLVAGFLSGLGDTSPVITNAGAAQATPVPRASIIVPVNRFARFIGGTK